MIDDQALWHPLVVHLPVGVIIVWGIFEAVALFLKKKRREFDLFFVLLAVVGMLSAFGANITGELAAETLNYTAALREAIEQHEDVAIFVAWYYLLLTLIGAVILVLPFNGLRVLRYGLACGLAVVIWVTGTRGGALVYEHGVGVIPMRSETLKAPPQKAPQQKNATKKGPMGKPTGP